MRKPKYLDDNNVAAIDNNESIMLDLKKSHKFMKTYFNNCDFDRRIKALNYEFKFSSLANFICPILEHIEDNVNRYFLYEGRDFTETLSWKFDFSLLIQTRSLGYLPQRVAFYQDQKYRALINSVKPLPPPEVTRTIETSVKDEFAECNIPSGLFHIDTEYAPQYLDDTLSMLNNIDMPIKMAASFNSILQEGGKLEDCRQLIKFAIKENIQIPIRDLNTNKIESYFLAKDTTSYSKIAFWLSYELAIEYLAAYLTAKKQQNHPLAKFLGMDGRPPIFPKEKIAKFLHAKILHIQEPLKQRNLTKSTSELTWFLTPAGKMMQEMLAKLPEHTVGLRYSNDA